MITSQMETKCKQTNFTCKADMKPILRDRIIKMICPLPLLKMLMKALKVAPYSFLSARALISKISRWRKRSDSTPKSRARSRSKMRTNMASKLLKFVYRKRCLDRLRFENICRLNRRPYLLLLDFKEKCTRYARVQQMKLICSIAKITERGKARWYITTHNCSPWRCLRSRDKS